MKLWELRGRLDVGPWRTLGAKITGFIVRAEDEEQARRLARDEEARKVATSGSKANSAHVPSYSLRAMPVC